MQIGRITPSDKRLTQHLIKSYANVISYKLGVTNVSVESLLYDATAKQVRFLEALADKYTGKYLYAAQKENPENVFNIFRQLKKPDKAHFGIIQYSNGSFEYFGKVFERSKSLSAHDRQKIRKI